MVEITVAIIGAGTSIFASVITLVGVFAKLKQSNSEIVNRLEKSQAVTETKIEELTREVREHNGFAKRMPVVEEQIRFANRRIDDLEKQNQH